MGLISTIITIISWAIQYGPTIFTLIQKIIEMVRSMSPADGKVVIDKVMAAKAEVDSTGDTTKLHEALSHICQNGSCRPRRRLWPRGN